MGDRAHDSTAAGDTSDSTSVTPRRAPVNLTPAQRAALQQRLAAKAATAPIPRRAPSRPAPLSASQELLWLLDQFGGGGWAYNAPDTRRLRGALDVEALRRALEAVVTTHEVLRTTYCAIDGEPVQQVQPPRRFPLEVVDLSSRPEPERTEKLHALLEAYSEVPFDLSRDIPVRARLFRLAVDDHVLVTVVHHIAIDGSSRHRFWSDLATAYALARSGEPVELPEPALQYADFAAWQRSALDRGELAEQLQWWVEHLAGAPSVLELPTDRPRPPVQSYRGAHAPRMLDREVLDGLRALAQHEGGTLFMATLALLATFLYRTTGEPDIVIGTPVASRNRVELESMIGYFANTLALRIDCSGNPTFRELVRRTKRTVIEAFTRQEVPFARVVQTVAPERDRARTPVFQVLTVLHNERQATVEFDGLTSERELHERRWSKFDLTIGMGEHDDGLGTGWEYCTDLFDAETIARMQERFAVLASAVALDADTAIDTLPFAPETEQDILDAWSEGPAPSWSDGLALHQLFERQAEHDPDAVAIVDGTTSTTYGELDVVSARLAACLQELGVGPDVPVAIACGRSTEFVVGALATLRAGGCCVPLDPDYPDDRLAAMVADAAPAVALVTKATAHRVPNGDHAVVDLDDLGGLPPISPRWASAPSAPEHLAYLVFTSGSTGQPRGVELTHRGLANHACAAVDHYALTPDDRVLQFCSVSFDISIEEIFPTLTAGATIVIRPADLPLGGAELDEWLAARGITVLDLPTAFWHEYTHDLVRRRAHPHRALRLVIVGGEAANAAVLDDWRAIAGPSVRWCNTYGPSEASVIATVWEPDSDFGGAIGADAGELPIGTPLPGCRVVIRDSTGSPAPIGTRGELCIGGLGLARGYRNRADLTAERFVADPRRPGERLYRTGDAARWRGDGTIEFCGRLDRQVKVRGFRVEPAEVEIALVRHDAVSEAHVGLHAETATLQAHVVADLGYWGGVHATAERALRDHVAATLPGYMVPSSVVVVAEFPRTPNGKVDVSALPAPERGGAHDQTVVAPRTETERIVVRAFERTLGPDRSGARDAATDHLHIGVHDDFFDLGGHSLLAVRLMSTIEAESGVRLPLVTLFHAATPAGVAAAIDAVQAGTGNAEAGHPNTIVTMRAGGAAAPLFLVHDPSGETLVYRNLVRALGDERPIHGIQARGVDRTCAPLTDIAAMADHYADEVQRVAPVGPYHLAGFCMGGVLAYETAVRLHERGATVGFVGLIDSVPFGHIGGDRTTVGNRITDNLRQLPAMTWRQRVAFVGENVVDGAIRYSRPLWWWLATRWYFPRDKALPRWMHDMEAVNFKVASTFVTTTSELPVQVYGGEHVRRDLGGLWNRVVAGRARYTTVGGPGVGHLTLLKEPHVRDVAATVAADIAVAELDARS